MAKFKGLEVDRRVGIAMSVLPPAQKNAVGRIISSTRSFALAAARPARVRQLHASGQPLSMLRVSPTLRLVFTLVGDTLYVVDLIERATLDHFALHKTAKKTAKGKKRDSKTDVRDTAGAGKK